MVNNKYLSVECLSNIRGDFLDFRFKPIWKLYESQGLTLSHYTPIYLSSQPSLEETIHISRADKYNFNDSDLMLLLEEKGVPYEFFPEIRFTHNFSALVHESQKRLSGKPYFDHVFSTSIYGIHKTFEYFQNNSLAPDYEFLTYVEKLCLLHDVLEDGEWVTYALLENVFGKEIADSVNKLTKTHWVMKKGVLERIKHSVDERKQKLRSYSSSEAIAGLSDREHNTEPEELKWLPRDRQIRKLRSTHRWYVRLAQDHKLFDTARSLQNKVNSNQSLYLRIWKWSNNNLQYASA